MFRVRRKIAKKEVFVPPKLEYSLRIISMFSHKLLAVILTYVLVGCAELPTSAFAQTSFTAMEAKIEVHTCRLLPNRTAECDLSITNKHQAKTVRTGGLKLRDGAGNEYTVENPSYRPRLYAPDETFSFSVSATNISTQANTIKSVIGTLYVRSHGSDRKYLGFGIGKPQTFILSGINMTVVQSEHSPEPVATTAHSQNAEPALKNSDRVDTAGVTSKEKASQLGWQVVGYWNYDAVDGQYLSQGLLLREKPGIGLGVSWQAHLELKRHSSLPARDRSLWPVKIHTGLKKVCANYPGYPSYQGHIDMPGNNNDGIYSFSECSGD